MIDKYLSAAYKQSALIGKYNADPKYKSFRHGYCLALSILWIRRHKRFKSEGAAKRMAALSTNRCIQDALEMQLVLEQRNTQAVNRAQMAHEMWNEFSPLPDKAKMAASVSSIGDAAALTEITVVGEERTRNIDIGTDSDNAFSFLTEINSQVNRTHQYFLLLHRNDVVGGHATCGYKSGGKWGFGSHLYFFDSNLGEYRVPASEIKPFFRGYFNKLTHKPSLYCIVPVAAN